MTDSWREAALAAALDADNYDLAAEVLWTWPMLGLSWTPAAAFGFIVLAAVQDAHGFLPGPGYSAEQHRRLEPESQDGYLLRTSYHATFVMGILCSVAVHTDAAPPVAVGGPQQRAGAADDIGVLLPEQRPQPRWRNAFHTLPADERDCLATLVLAVALRRARNATDLHLVRKILRVSLRHGLVDGPAPGQAVGLLRRASIIGAGRGRSEPALQHQGDAVVMVKTGYLVGDGADFRVGVGHRHPMPSPGQQFQVIGHVPESDHIGRVHIPGLGQQV